MNKLTHRHYAEHGHGDKHIVKVGEDVLLDGDDGGEEVSEEDEDEAADQEGGDTIHLELKFTQISHFSSMQS